jgi:hypothetical protein
VSALYRLVQFLVMVFISVEGPRGLFFWCWRPGYFANGKLGDDRRHLFLRAIWRFHLSVAVAERVFGRDGKSSALMQEWDVS